MLAGCCNPLRRLVISLMDRGVLPLRVTLIWVPETQGGITRSDGLSGIADQKETRGWFQIGGPQGVVPAAYIDSGALHDVGSLWQECATAAPKRRTGVKFGLRSHCAFRRAHQHSGQKLSAQTRTADICPGEALSNCDVEPK